MVIDFLSIPGWDWCSIVLVWGLVTCFEVCGLEFVCIGGFRVILLFLVGWIRVGVSGLVLLVCVWLRVWWFCRLRLLRCWWLGRVCWVFAGL